MGPVAEQKMAVTGFTKFVESWRTWGYRKNDVVMNT